MTDMKTKLIYGILALFVMPFIAKAQSRQQPATAVEMNNYLASFTDSLYKKGGEWGQIFVASKDSKDFSKLVKPRKDFTMYIENSISEIKSTQDIAGSEDIKNAFIKFLTFEKTAVNYFIPFEKLNSNSTDTEIDALVNGLNDFSTLEIKELKKLNVVQQEYASKNNFNIETK